ncbi:MAG TPA: hypothetical protein VGY75_12415 [Candidatus Udaeobacter sp.]|nr:hypothetical protein [Candidatus Udaeobacter sp.]
MRANENDLGFLLNDLQRHHWVDFPHGRTFISTKTLSKNVQFHHRMNFPNSVARLLLI